MLGHLLLPEIQEMVRSGDFAGLRDALGDWMPPDLAELIAELPPEDEAVIFRILPNRLSAETFGYLPLESQEKLLRGFGDEKTGELLNLEILNNMAPDDRTALLEELPGEVTRRLLTLLSPEERAVAQKLLAYPEDSIGRRMTPDYLAIGKDWTVDQVLDHIRSYGNDSETLNILYVTDDRGKLRGAVRLREFLLCSRDKPVSELMASEVISMKATEDQEAAVQAFRKYDVVALPVTDQHGVLVGILTVDDVLDVAEQEATEDIQKIGGMQALEEPYINIAFWRMVGKRAPWLVILFCGQTLTAMVIGGLGKGIVLQAAILNIFVPLIISSGGNSGSQAATLVVRALALGEVRLKDWWRIMKREILAGLALGATLAVLSFTGICVISLFNAKTIGAHSTLVALTVSISLIGVVLWGTLTGSMLPLLLKRLGFDPATSSSPFVATLVDVTGLVIYFSVAVLVLTGTLLH